jgi:N-acyl-D-amino-acid deacylase
LEYIYGNSGLSFLFFKLLLYFKFFDMIRIMFFIVFFLLWACVPTPKYDYMIINATIVDGSGAERSHGMVGVNADTIAYVGEPIAYRAKEVLDIQGLVVSPGFINMLSWGYDELMEDGRSLSDLRQGVTLEVFGEGHSPGPSGTPGGEDFQSFGEAMEALESKGVSPNIASYLGATTVRVQTLGYANRKASPAEREQMKAIVETAMQEGALGIGSSLIYAPADYADTDELVFLNRVASSYNGRYISHMRSEGRAILEALDELLTVAQEANVPAEIYHLKASRRTNWHLLDSVIARIERARMAGLQITADMYTYHASSTGLTNVIPTWVQEGGHSAWIARMQDPAVRPRLLKEIAKELEAQPAEGILMVGFNKEDMDALYRGKTIAQVSQERGTSPEETIVDLVVEDDSRIQCIYFSMSEDNIRKKIQLPWVSFCSDAGTYSDISINFRTHPRAFGSFARVLGKFSREEGLISLEEAVRKLAHLPATNLGIEKRGLLKVGNYADLVVFDPETVTDHATFDDPLQYATGVQHVWVNGVAVLKNGQHSGAFPGRFVKGSGAK